MYSVRQFILGPENEYLAVSRGIDGVDLSEIRQWSAKRGDLISSEPMAYSWNFHPLPTGCFCLSRTNRTALLFPKADPEEVFTHGILLPQSLLKDYANNALLLARRLEKLGFWRAGLEVTRQLLSMSEEERRNRASRLSGADRLSGASPLPALRTLSMDGGAEAVRLNSLNAFVRTTGIRRFCSILDLILGNFLTIITGNAVPEMLVEALLDVLPIGCRLEISFSTGLRFSSDRFFRAVFIGNDQDEQKKIQREFTLPMISSTSVSLMQEQLLPTLRNRWSMFIATLFEQNKEMDWGDIAVLDETSSLQELSKRARFWFRKLGMEAIYQKIRETRKKGNFNGEESYGIFKTQVSDSDEVQKILSSIFKSLPRDGKIGSRADVCGAEALDSAKLRALPDSLENFDHDEKKLISDENTPASAKDERSEETGDSRERAFPFDDEQVLKQWENGAMRELIREDDKKSSEKWTSKRDDGEDDRPEAEFEKKNIWNGTATGGNEAFSHEFYEKTGFSANDTPKKREVVMPGAMNSYLATLSEAMHGNPLAQNRLKKAFQEIRSGVSEARKDQVAETLLREGVRNWNEEHNSMQNVSWRRIEEMVDTLSTMMDLSCGKNA